jgi:tartrate-resistant acid phosphatase type 5
MKSLRPLILLTCVVIFASFSVAAAYHLLTPIRAGTGDSWSMSAIDALPAAVPPIGTPAAGHVRFAVIGDFGAGGQDEADVAAQVKSWTPDFVVTVGDNRYNNRYGSNYDTVVGQFFCEYLKDAGPGPSCAGGTSAINRFFPATGNHDSSDGGGLKEYLAYFALPGNGVASSGTSGNERYYDFAQGPVHIFVVDSLGAITSGADMKAQRTWLQAQLAASTAAWKLVVFHHPPYSSGTHGSTPAMQWPFRSWGADAILSGHDHSYERVQVDGIPYFVNGIGGKSRYGFKAPVAGSAVRFSADFGAMLVDASSDSITYQLITRAGVLIDTYTVVKTQQPVIATPPAPATRPAGPTPTRRGIWFRPE